jgi:glycerophosphoryl diester phosphodiesterase
MSRLAGRGHDGAVRQTWTYLDSPGPVALAHRGAHDAQVAENSMAAFERAVSLGYRYIETDVHATADGVLVAFHDSTLDRVTDRRGAIAQMTWAEVSRARLSDSSTIPLAQDVLGTWPHMRVNIDAKSDGAVGPLLDVLHRTRAHARVCVGSFSDRRTRTLRRALPPGTATALAPREVAALRIGLPPGSPWLPREVPCVQVPERQGRIRIVDPTFVERVHAQGRVVHVWTINDEADMRRLLDLGVDGLVTDEAELLARVLASRAPEGRPPGGSGADA